jgi:hypothetical protein
MNPRFPLQLIRIQAKTLFVLNSNDRMLTLREPDHDDSERRPAPRFFMGRTLEGNLWRFRHDLPDTFINGLTDFCQREPVANSLADPPQYRADIRTILESHFPITKEYRGPAYLVPDRIQPPKNIVSVNQDNAFLLEANFPWALKSNSIQRNYPISAAVEQGSAVSICFCSRLSSWAAEAGVETVPAHRNQGYGSAVISGWASEIQRRGLIALYSTSWENNASQRISAKIGMSLYGENWWLD